MPVTYFTSPYPVVTITLIAFHFFFFFLKAQSSRLVEFISGRLPSFFYYWHYLDYDKKLVCECRHVRHSFLFPRDKWYLTNGNTTNGIRKFFAPFLSFISSFSFLFFSLPFFFCGSPARNAAYLCCLVLSALPSLYTEHSVAALRLRMCCWVRRVN